MNFPVNPPFLWLKTSCLCQITLRLNHVLLSWLDPPYFDSDAKNPDSRVCLKLRFTPKNCFITMTSSPWNIPWDPQAPLRHHRGLRYRSKQVLPFLLGHAPWMRWLALIYIYIYSILPYDFTRNIEWHYHILIEIFIWQYKIKSYATHCNILDYNLNIW